MIVLLNTVVLYAFTMRTVITGLFACSLFDDLNPDKAEWAELLKIKTCQVHASSDFEDNYELSRFKKIFLRNSKIHILNEKIVSCWISRCVSRSSWNPAVSQRKSCLNMSKQCTLLLASVFLDSWTPFADIFFWRNQPESGTKKNESNSVNIIHR